MPNVTGSEELAVPADQLWALLNDPQTLSISIPGCDRLERTADHVFTTTLTVTVGPVLGVYSGTVEYRDIQAPTNCTIAVSGHGDKGTIDGAGRLTLHPHGELTTVNYEGSFRITGPVATIGQRLVPGISRKMIVETLHNLERNHQGFTEPAADAEAATETTSPPPARRPKPDAPMQPARAVSGGAAPLTIGAGWGRWVAIGAAAIVVLALRRRSR
jgi:carbon monoxide dehydrogenase subunit G